MNCYAASSASIRPEHQRGFSLLELLVVIVIIGILISFTTLAIRGADPEDLIKEEAQRFNQLLQLAQEEAIFKGLEYGVAFTPNSYTFLVQIENQWRHLDDDRLLRTRELQHNVEIELSVDQTGIVLTSPNSNPGTTASDDKPELNPQTYLLSSGEITPEFSAKFVIYGVDKSYQVTAHIDGKHEIKTDE